MQTDAIQQDVSTADQAGTVVDDGAATGSEAILSPRELAMQEISQQLLEEQQAAGFGVPDEVREPEPAKLPEVLADDQLASVKVKVKVDGVEVELPLSDVTKGYQKDAVASRRLAQAADERKKLEKWEGELKAREAALISDDSSSSTQTGDTDSQIKAAMAALVEGDEVAAAEALKAILGSGRQETTQQPVIDEDAIIAKAEARLENKKAWDDFVGSNPAFADEASKQRQYGDYLFDSVYSPLISSGELSYREALMKTADEVNAVFVQQQAQTPRQQKEERKRGIDNLPVAAGARAAGNTTQPKTVEDTLDEMRRARGQFV